MRTTVVILIITIVTFSKVTAQGFAVGVDAPDPAAIVEFLSANKGILIPRLTTAQRDAIPGLGAAQEGLMLFNATTDEFNYWNGASWIRMATNLANNWSTLGNTGTIDGTNFIGTTDNVPFNIRVFNQKAARINSTGQTFFGYQAGNVNTGATNTGIGFQSLFSNTSGSDNVSVGYYSLYTNTTGSVNTAVGAGTLYFNQTGNFNTAFGGGALLNNTTGNFNTGIGFQAFNLNTTGYSNTGVGTQTLFSNTTGFYNTAVGEQALFSNTTGSYNVGVGYHALRANTTANLNIAIGAFALLANTTGTSNIAIGLQALDNNVSGPSNAAIGTQALDNNLSGENNFAFGTNSGSIITTGSYNSFFGSSANADAVNRTNTIALAGNGNLTHDGDNRVRIGNASMTSIGGQVTWSALSDARIKNDIQENVHGLDFIMKLRPVTYFFDVDKSNALQNIKYDKSWTSQYDIEKMRFSGFIAQEVEAAAQSINYEFSGVDKPQDEDGLWGLRYAEFTVPLVKAAQELNQKDLELLDLIRQLQMKINEMQLEINQLKAK